MESFEFQSESNNSVTAWWFLWEFGYRITETNLLAACGEFHHEMGLVANVEEMENSVLKATIRNR